MIINRTLQLVPEPENFMGTALNSTSILLTWDGRQSNGFITEYEVIKTASLFEPNDEIFNVIVAVTMLTGISLEVINLEEGFEYNFDISAKYDSFFSTTSTTTVFTDEIGLFLFFYYKIKDQNYLNILSIF